VTLFKKSKTGKVQQWSIKTDKDKIIVTWGQVGGKQQTKTTKTTPKNRGKINETTAEEQAILEMEALIIRQLERKKYTKDPSGETENNYAMKVSDYKNISAKAKKDLFSSPFYLSTKYNGVNAMFIYKDGWTIQSRTGKTYPSIPHIEEELNKIRLKYNINIFNVELFIPNTPLQLITSAVTKPNSISKDLVALIFDIPEKGNLPYSERYKILKDIPNSVKSIKATTEKKLEDYYKSIVEDKAFPDNGVEGIIIRKEDSKYTYNIRSNEVWKYKPVMDDEFKVVNYSLDKNGNPVLECETKDRVTFKVNPKGTFEEKQRLLKELPKRIGDYYKVEYETWSVDKQGNKHKPVKPIGIDWREVNNNIGE
jgi:ATP-dependent DNA ligase/predicted DNA-binding WGR domain protein